MNSKEKSSSSEYSTSEESLTSGSKDSKSKSVSGEEWDKKPLISHSDEKKEEIKPSKQEVSSSSSSSNEEKKGRQRTQSQKQKSFINSGVESFEEVGDQHLQVRCESLWWKLSGIDRNPPLYGGDFVGEFTIQKDGKVLGEDIHKLTGVKKEYFGTYDKKTREFKVKVIYSNGQRGTYSGKIEDTTFSLRLDITQGANPSKVGDWSKLEGTCTWTSLEKFITIKLPVRQKRVDRGLFYWLGTHNHIGEPLETFSNPASTGALIPVIGPGWYNITNRTTDSRFDLLDMFRCLDFKDKNELKNLKEYMIVAKDYGLGFDIGREKKFCPTHYTIYDPYDPSTYRYSWKFQAWDKKTHKWIDLDIREKDTTGIFTDQFEIQHATFEIPKEKREFYSIFRLITSAEWPYTVCSGLELYGELKYKIPSSKYLPILEMKNNDFVYFPQSEVVNGSGNNYCTKKGALTLETAERLLQKKKVTRFSKKSWITNHEVWGQTLVFVIEQSSNDFSTWRGRGFIENPATKAKIPVWAIHALNNYGMCFLQTLEIPWNHSVEDVKSHLETFENIFPYKSEIHFYAYESQNYDEKYSPPKPDQLTWISRKPVDSAQYTKVSCLFNDKEFGETGLFYWLGTHTPDGKQVPFSNPHSTGAVKTVVTPQWYNITGKTTDDRKTLDDIYRVTMDKVEMRTFMIVGFQTGIGFDIGEKRRFHCTHYTLYNPYDPKTYMSSWTVEGFDLQKKTWVILDKREDDGTGINIDNVYQLATFKCNKNIEDKFSIFRLKSTTTDYTIACCLEFYGTLEYVATFQEEKKLVESEAPCPNYVYWPDNTTLKKPEQNLFKAPITGTQEIKSQTKVTQVIVAGEPKMFNADFGDVLVFPIENTEPDNDLHWRGKGFIQAVNTQFTMDIWAIHYLNFKGYCYVQVHPVPFDLSKIDQTNIINEFSKKFPIGTELKFFYSVSVPYLRVPPTSKPIYEVNQDTPTPSTSVPTVSFEWEAIGTVANVKVEKNKFLNVGNGVCWGKARSKTGYNSTVEVVIEATHCKEYGGKCSNTHVGVISNLSKKEVFIKGDGTLGGTLSGRDAKVEFNSGSKITMKLHPAARYITFTVHKKGVDKASASITEPLPLLEKSDDIWHFFGQVIQNGDSMSSLGALQISEEKTPLKISQSQLEIAEEKSENELNPLKAQEESEEIVLQENVTFLSHLTLQLPSQNDAFILVDPTKGQYQVVGRIDTTSENAAKTVFIIEPRYNYSAKIELDSINIELSKIQEKKKDNKSGQNNLISDLDSIEKNLVEARDKAKKAWKLEKSTNDLKKENLKFTPITYGTRIQLRHAQTGKFLVSDFSKASKPDPFALDIDISSTPSPLQWFRVLPKYSFRSIGERIRSGDHIILEHIETEHSLEVGPTINSFETKRTRDSDFHLRLARGSPSAIVIKSCVTLTDANLVKNGDVVRIHHSVYDQSVLDLSLNRPFWMPNATKLDPQELTFTTASKAPTELFEIQSPTSQTGSQLKYGKKHGTHFHLLHLATNKYLCIDEKKPSTYCLQDIKSTHPTKFFFEQLDKSGSFVNYSHLLRISGLRENQKESRYISSLSTPELMTWQKFGTFETTINNALYKSSSNSISKAISTQEIIGATVVTISIDSGKQTNGSCSGIEIGILKSISRQTNFETMHINGDGRITINSISSVEKNVTFGVGDQITIIVDPSGKKITWSILSAEGVSQESVTRDWPSQWSKIIGTVHFYASLSSKQDSVSFIPTSSYSTKSPVIFSSVPQYQDILYLEPSSSSELQDVDRIATITKNIIDSSTMKTRATNKRSVAPKKQEEKQEKEKEKLKTKKREGRLIQAVSTTLVPPRYLKNLHKEPQLCKRILEELRKLKNFLSENCSWGTSKQKRDIVIHFKLHDHLFRILTESFDIEPSEWSSVITTGGSDGLTGTATKKLIRLLETPVLKEVFLTSYELLKVLCTKNPVVANLFTEYFEVIFGQISVKVGAKRLANEIFSADIGIITSIDIGSINSFISNFEDSNDQKSTRHQETRFWDILNRLCYYEDVPIPRNQTEILETFKKVQVPLFFPMTLNEGEPQIKVQRKQIPLINFVSKNGEKEDKNQDRNSTLIQEGIELNDLSPKNKDESSGDEREEDRIKDLNPTPIGLKFKENPTMDLFYDEAKEGEPLSFLYREKENQNILWSVAKTKDPIKIPEKGEVTTNPKVLSWKFIIGELSTDDPNTWKICCGVSDFLGKNPNEADTKNFSGGYGNAWGIELGGCQLISSSPQHGTKIGKRDTRFQGKPGTEITLILNLEEHTLSFLWNGDLIVHRHTNVNIGKYYPFVSFSFGDHEIRIPSNITKSKKNRENFWDPSSNSQLKIIKKNVSSDIPQHSGWILAKSKNLYTSGVNSFYFEVTKVNKMDTNDWKMCIGIAEAAGFQNSKIASSRWCGQVENAWGMALGNFKGVTSYSTEAIDFDEKPPKKGKSFEFKTGLFIKVTANLDKNILTFAWSYKKNKDYTDFNCKFDLQQGIQVFPFISFSGKHAIRFVEPTDSKSDRKEEKRLKVSDEEEEDEEDLDLTLSDESAEFNSYDSNEEFEEDYYNYNSNYDDYSSHYESDVDKESSEEEEEVQTNEVIQYDNEIFRTYLYGSLHWIYSISIASHTNYASAIQIARGNKKLTIREFIRDEARPIVFPDPKLKENPIFPNIRAIYADLIRLHLEQTLPDRSTSIKYLWAAPELEKKTRESFKIELDEENDWIEKYKDEMNKSMEKEIFSFQKKMESRAKEDSIMIIALLKLLEKFARVGLYDIQNQNIVSALTKILSFSQKEIDESIQNQLSELYLVVIKLLALASNVEINKYIKTTLRSLDLKKFNEPSSIKVLSIEPQSHLVETLIKLSNTTNPNLRENALHLLYHVARPTHRLHKAYKKLTLLTNPDVCKLYEDISLGATEILHLIADNDISIADQPNILNILKHFILLSCDGTPQNPNQATQFIFNKISIHKIMFHLLSLNRTRRAKPIFVLAYWVIRQFVLKNPENQELLIPYLSTMLDDMKYGIGSQYAIKNMLEGNLKVIEKVKRNQIDLIIQAFSETPKISYLLIIFSLLSTFVNITKMQEQISESFFKYFLSQISAPWGSENPADIELPFEFNLTLTPIEKLDPKEKTTLDEAPLPIQAQIPDDYLIAKSEKDISNDYFIHALVIELLVKLCQNNPPLVTRLFQLAQSSMKCLSKKICLQVVTSKAPTKIIAAYSSFISIVYFQTKSEAIKKIFSPVIIETIERAKELNKTDIKAQSASISQNLIKGPVNRLFGGLLPLVSYFISVFGDPSHGIQGEKNISTLFFNEKDGLLMEIHRKSLDISDFTQDGIKKLSNTLSARNYLTFDQKTKIQEFFSEPVAPIEEGPRLDEESNEESEPDLKKEEIFKTQIDNADSLMLLISSKLKLALAQNSDKIEKEFSDLLDKFKERIKSLSAGQTVDLISQLETQSKSKSNDDYLRKATLKILVSLIKIDEEEDEDLELSERLSLKYKQSSTLREIQQKLGDFHALTVALDLLNAEDLTVISYTAEFGANVLNGNSSSGLQRQLTEYLRGSGFYFFSNISRLLTHYFNSFSELSTVHPQKKDFAIPVLKLLQAMCESHNLEMKNLMREQRNQGVFNKASILILRYVVQVTNVNHDNWKLWAEDKVFNIHYGNWPREENVDIETCFSLAKQCWETLTEFSTGCEENQFDFIHTYSFSSVNWYLSESFTRACSNNDLIQSDNRGSFYNFCKNPSIPLYVQCLEMQSSGINFLLSLTETLTGLSQPVESISKNLIINIPFIEMAETMRYYYGIVNKISATKFYPGFKRNVENFLTSCLILMRIMSPFASSDSKIHEVLQKYESFSKLHIGVIEVISKGKLQTVYYKIPKNCQVGVNEDSKSEVLNALNRDTPAEKVSDFLKHSDRLEVEIEHRENLRTKPISNIVTSVRLWKFFLTILTLTINILLIVTYTTNEFDDQTILKPQPSIRVIIFILGSLHSFFSILHCSGHIWIRFPLVFKTKKVENSKTERLQRSNLQNLTSTVKEKDEAEQPKYYLNKLAYITSLISSVEKTFHEKKQTFFGFFDGITIWYILYTLTSIIATAIAPALFSLHLLDISIQDPRVRTVLQAVTKNGKSLLLTALLGLIVIYEFTMIGFFFLRSDYAEANLSCENLAQCLLTTFSFGIRSGIGDVLELRQFGDNEFGLRYVFDLSFFIIVVIILLNVIFGIILDTFSELRSAREQIEHDNNTKCLICSIPNEEFQLREGADGFPNHIKQDHNIWKYLYFFVYLDSKDQDEYNAVEWDVNQKRLANDTSFFPLNRSLRLKRENPDENSAQIEIKKELQEIKDKIDNQLKEKEKEKEKED